MSIININQTSFDHTFQSNVTFLSSSFFQSNAIVASDAKLEVNGTSTFIGASSFSGAATFKDTVSVNSSITGESLEISSSSTLNNININGKLYDGDGNFGTSGQLLSSDGTDLNWINASTTSVANANNVGTNVNSTNEDQFITFVSASSGNNPIRVDVDLKYNPSTNTLSAINIAGSSTAVNLDVTGNLTVGGQLNDGAGNFGISGQVLSSDGTDTAWINADSLTAGAASEVGVTAVNDNSSHFVTFVDSSSGNENIKVDTNLTYNPGTNIISSQISDISNHDTDDLSEGSTNLYYTNARADARISAADTDDLTEGSSNLYYTNARADARADARISAADTNDLSEGSTNKYFTTARARASVSATGDLSYNSSNGQFSVSVPSAFVSGMIILWSGSIGSIPSGFVLCNGSNNTPNLRNRFVIGAGSSYSVNATGGSANATLVSHSHGAGTYGTNSAGSHQHSEQYARAEFNGEDPGFSRWAYSTASGNQTNNIGNSTGSHSHNVSGNSSTAGSSSANANLPPYYALCYIMKT